MPPFKDEHVLIIAPGSQTTLAQLGLPESFTPAQWRFPTRMFPAAKEGEWEPHKVREKKKAGATTVKTTNGTANGVSGSAPAGDVEMTDQQPAAETKPETSAEEASANAYEEDQESLEGVVYPVRGGRIENWSCFLALMTHVYNTLSPPFHTPVLVVAQPCWTSRDQEILTQFFFENFKIPAFSLVDSALLACYAYGVPSALVIDIGHEKADITAVSEFVPQEKGRGIALPDAGGDAMTQRLLELLQNQGFSYEMCEQIKKSGVCEILPAGVAMPGHTNGSSTAEPNPAAVAGTGANGPGLGSTDVVDGTSLVQASKGFGVVPENGEPREEGEENEGVLDVASIVARGDASEFLAKREKEKAEKAAAKKAGAADSQKQARLKNSERENATFSYEDYVLIEEGATDAAGPMKKRKRDIQVGPERFAVATPKAGSSLGIIDIIAAAVHSTVLSIVEPNKRSDVWDNVIILGNGSRVRGFKEVLLNTLASRYTLSPSSATIFTSELPSNMSTPLPTGGTNTPLGTPSHPMHHPAAHGVNPLLVAATHANQPIPPQTFNPTQNMLELTQHRGNSQTPTSIKTVKTPEYFPEWKDPRVSGMEEAGFLGAQVAAKVVFVVDQGSSKGFLTRSDYNEMGPSGIHECGL